MTARSLGWAVLPVLMHAGAAMPVAAAPARPDTQVEFDQALRDFDEAQRFQNNQPDRARQLFRSAAQRLISIAAGGVVNGRLEFNVGNCLLQLTGKLIR